LNDKKRLAKLRYKDEILKLYQQGINLREIAKKINYKLVRTNLKTTLSYSTIFNIIKKYKDL
jgi:transposase